MLISKQCALKYPVVLFDMPTSIHWTFYTSSTFTLWAANNTSFSTLIRAITMLITNKSAWKYPNAHNQMLAIIYRKNYGSCPEPLSKTLGYGQNDERMDKAKSIYTDINWKMCRGNNDGQTPNTTTVKLVIKVKPYWQY